ncbi:MAG: tetraacyldisaccharide 4'-kinase [bacterium]
MPRPRSREAADFTREFLYEARPRLAIAILRAFLLPLGWTWSAVLTARRVLYRCGVLRGARAGVPVISIGNVTVGGTGKTPLVEWVAHRALALGVGPGIVTRGYGASAGSAPRRVVRNSTGESDEAILLAARLPEAVVVAGRDRVRGARLAIDAGARVIILDDGFQHLPLRRDLDIVLLDTRVPYRSGRVLPAGALREPWSAARDAHLAVVLADVAAPQTAPPGIPVARAVRRNTAVRRASGARELPESLHARRVFLLSGIGHPEAFRNSAVQAGAIVVGEQASADHHRFTQHEIDDVIESSRDANAEIILTTEKDASRLPALFLARADVAILETAIDIVEGEALFTDLVDRALRGEMRAKE